LLSKKIDQKIHKILNFYKQINKVNTYSVTTKGTRTRLRRKLTYIYLNNENLLKND